MPFDPLPVSEVFGEGVEVRCALCASLLEDEVCLFNDANYCEECLTQLIAKLEEEARAYALANCAITKPIPPYDPRREFRCSREDYEMGSRESYTPNSHRCHARHNCTNYESLIRPLSKISDSDVILYQAIRDRIEDLLTEAIDESWYDASLLDDADTDDDRAGSTPTRRPLQE